MARGVVDQSIVKGQTTGIVVVDALCDPHLLPLGLQALCGIRKRLDGLKRGFFQKGTQSEDSRGMALIAWDVVFSGVLGVLHLHAIIWLS